MPYIRQWPRGPYGYPNEQRRNATVLQPAVATPQSRADLLVCSARTLRRWRAQVQRLGHADRRGVNGGRPLKLSCKAAYVLYWYKTVRADATYRQCRRMVQFLCNEDLRPNQCSRELRRLGFTRKKLAHLSRRRDEAQRVSWWISPPMPAVPGGPRGVHGLDTRLLIDIDEKPIWLHHTNRQYGHALQGHRGVVHRARDPREGRKATLLLVRRHHSSLPVSPVLIHARVCCVCRR